MDPIIDGVTFEQFVAYARRAAASLVDGEPWSFSFHGHPVTQEHPGLYLISTPAGQLQFAAGQTILVDNDRNLSLATSVEAQIHATFTAGGPPVPPLAADPGAVDRLVEAWEGVFGGRDWPETRAAAAATAERLRATSTRSRPPATPQEIPPMARDMKINAEATMTITAHLPGAPPVELAAWPGVAGAIMKFEERPDGRQLQLLASTAEQGGRGTPLTYIAYRDGHDLEGARFALSIDAATGAITAQLRGVGVLPLEELEAIVRAHRAGAAAPGGGTDA